MSSRRSFLKTALVGSAAVPGAALAKSGASAVKTKIDRRVLGRTGAEVSILGLGLGSAFTGPYENDREKGEKLLHIALDHGVNYWDTSRGYGASEEMLAPVLQQRRQEVFLVSKSNGRDYDSCMRDFETSLKTLRVDYLDTFHMWNLKPSDDLDQMERGAFKAVRELKEQGVIKSYGVTGHSGARLLMDAVRRFDPDTLLTVFPCTRDDAGRYEDELLPLARERNMGVIGMKTVRRARNADLVGSDLIRYSLSLEGVHSTIVGLDTLAHLNENLAMATNFEPLSKARMAQLHEEAVVALKDIPTPWEQPGYQDGKLAGRLA